MFELEEDIKKKLLEGMLANSPQLGGPAMMEGRGTPGELYQENIRQQQVAQAEQNARNNIGIGQALAEDFVGSLTAGPGIGQLADLLSSLSSGGGANKEASASLFKGGQKGLTAVHDFSIGRLIDLLRTADNAGIPPTLDLLSYSIAKDPTRPSFGQGAGGTMVLAPDLVDPGNSSLIDLFARDAYTRRLPYEVSGNLQKENKQLTPQVAICQIVPN